MKKNINYMFIGIIFLLIGCQNNDLDIELEKAIIDYENKIPIPKNEYNKKFIYVVDFALKDKDTVIMINRRSKGVFKTVKYYGVYKLNDGIPVVISDDKKLGERFIKNRLKNSLLEKYHITSQNVEFDEYPPVYTYLIKKENIELLRIDTISNNWIK